MRLLVIALIALALPAPLQAKWLVAESDHFVIYADDSEKDIQRFATILESYHAAMERLTGRRIEKPSPSNRVTVYTVGSTRDVQALAETKSRLLAGFYIPRFQNLGDDKREYLRGFGYQGSASRDGWSRAVAELGIGGEFKDKAAEPGSWRMGATAFGEMLPDHRNRITLDQSKKDKWGLPVLAIDCQIRENELKMRKDMGPEMAAMLEAAGAKDVNVYEGDYAPGMGIHEMGTARMGTSPRNSVLNKHNQVWDAPNVFVTDGAAMTSASCVNPSLTYMALTARAADFAVNELNRRNI